MNIVGTAIIVFLIACLVVAWRLELRRNHQLMEEMEKHREFLRNYKQNQGWKVDQ